MKSVDFQLLLSAQLLREPVEGVRIQASPIAVTAKLLAKRSRPRSRDLREGHRARRRLHVHHQATVPHPEAQTVDETLEGWRNPRLCPNLGHDTIAGGSGS
jgi:hypothetical protein